MYKALTVPRMPAQQQQVRTHDATCHGPVGHVGTSPRPLPFPREGVPTNPPDGPCFTAPCRVHTEDGWGWGGGGAIKAEGL